MRRMGTAGAQYVLTVAWLGQVYRFAETDTEIDGVVARGGLTATGAESAVELFRASSPPEPTVAGLIFPLDVAREEMKGRWLQAARAELCRYADSWSSRQIVAVGRVSNPEYGLEGEAVSFSIVTDGAEELRQWPPAAYVVDATTWPDAPESSHGQRYPAVVGSPSLSSDADSTVRGVCPAIVLSVGAGVTLLLVSIGVVGAASVRVFRTDTEDDQTCPITQTTDENGVQVAIATWTGTPSGATFRADWPAGFSGIIGPDGAPLGPLGGVIEWLLGHSSVKWDVSAWRSARDVLDAYSIDGYFDEPIEPWPVARDQLLTLAPVSVRSGEDGVYPVTLGSAPRLTLEVGRNCERFGAFQTDGEHIGNEWAMSCAPDRTGQNTLNVTRSASDDLRSQVSADTFGIVAAPESLESRHVYDEATASRSIGWKARIYSTPHIQRSVEAYGVAERALLPGDMVQFIDVEGGIDSAFGYVVETENDRDSIAIAITIIPTLT